MRPDSPLQDLRSVQTNSRDTHGKSGQVQRILSSRWRIRAGSHNSRTRRSASIRPSPLLLIQAGRQLGPNPDNAWPVHTYHQLLTSWAFKEFRWLFLRGGARVQLSSPWRCGERLVAHGFGWRFLLVPRVFVLFPCLAACFLESCFAAVRGRVPGCACVGLRRLQLLPRNRYSWVEASMQGQYRSPYPALTLRSATTPRLRAI